MINKLEPGDRQLSASSWNEMRDRINNITPSQNTILTGNKNPFLITVKNITGSALPIYSIVKVDTPMYNRGNFDGSFEAKAAQYGVEVEGDTPDKDDNIVAVLQEACPAGGIVKAVVSGVTACKVMPDWNEVYEYARPKPGETGYLELTHDTTNIRVLWHLQGPGSVTKNAYVILGDNEAQPVKITPHLNADSDQYPDGANQLSSTDTYLYCSSLDKIDGKNTDNPPYVYNPLGLPLDRPTVLAKAVGFPANVEDPTSGTRHIGELVAIGSDTRDFFRVNPGNAYYSGDITADQNGAPGDYLKRGNLYYIQEPNTAEGHYNVIEGYISSLGGMRLAVCQRDMPENWTPEFKMPYYPLEMNYGCKPNVSTVTGETFTERCGVYPGENKLSNKRLDYHFSNGRYSYEPIFTYTGPAKGTVGSRQVYIEIEGNDYLCGTMQGGSSASLSVPWGCYPPDIYPGDMITVQVDARQLTPIITIIQCPRDYPENAEIIANTYAINPQRGWTDVTSEYTNQLGNNGVLVLGTGVSGISAHYSGDSTGAQIPQLYFHELGFRIWRKNKTNAIL